MKLNKLAIATYKGKQLVGYLIMAKEKILIIGVLSDGTFGTFQEKDLTNVFKISIKHKSRIEVSDNLKLDNSPEGIGLLKLINEVNNR